MSKPTNVECFESAAAALLGTLYQEFPKPIPIISGKIQDDLIKRLLIAPECVWPESRSAPGENIVTSSLAWLIEEGFVRAKTVSGTRFSGVVLTAKGFRAMNSPILADPTGETHGERIVKFVGGQMLEGIGSTIGSLIQAGASGLFGS